MLPSRSFSSSSSAGPSTYAPMQQGFPTVGVFPTQDFIPQSLQDQSLTQGGDPNIPEVFKQNILLIRDNVLQLQNIARSTLAGIQNAYHTGNTPAQTEADLATLRQTIQVISDIMRNSGVGALPLLPTSVVPGAPASAPTEQQLLEDTENFVRGLYEQAKRGQESAAVAANLLGAPDLTARIVR